MTFCITANSASDDRFGSIAPNAARVLQQRMSVAARKRQLATKVRCVVKGQDRTHALQQNRGDLTGQFCPWTTRRWRLVAGVFSRLDEGRSRARQNNPEFGEVARLGVDLYGPAMLLDDDVVTNGQT